jgi:hypothetical protein
LIWTGEQVAVVGKGTHALPRTPVGYRVGQIGVDQASCQPLLVDHGSGEPGQNIRPVCGYRHLPHLGVKDPA